MNFIPTKIPDLIIVEPQVFGDHRGFFMETWHQKKFQDAGINSALVQDNHSRSVQGVLRGLHYQIRQPQGKLVRVIEGEIYDVALDMRKKSPTFGQWVGMLLSAANKKMLWVPPGFAHGFYVTSEVAEFVYKCSDFYAPEFERTVLWNDPALQIDWPLIDGNPPVLSPKDENGTVFKKAEYFG